MSKKSKKELGQILRDVMNEFPMGMDGEQIGGRRPSFSVLKKKERNISTNQVEWQSKVIFIFFCAICVSKNIIEPKHRREISSIITIDQVYRVENYTEPNRHLARRSFPLSICLWRGSLNFNQQLNNTRSYYSIFFSGWYSAVPQIPIKYAKLSILGLSWDHPTWPNFHLVQL